MKHLTNQNYFSHLICTAVLTLSFSGNLYCQPGSNDPTFNVADANIGANNSVNFFAIQPDGKILIDGLFTSYNGVVRNELARLNGDGTLDNTFSPSIVNNSIVSFSVQTDGKVIISGPFTTYSGVPCNGIARINADGTLDNTFNTGSGANAGVYSTQVLTSGKIIISGSFTSYNGISRNGIARLNTDGSLDASFDPGLGANNVDIYDPVYSTVQPDGRILIWGAFTSFNGQPKNYFTRLNADGSLDNTFNNGVAGPNASITSATVQPDGRVLIDGYFNTYDGSPILYLARINSDGSLDNSFNPSSSITSGARPSSITLQPSGKMVVVVAYSNNTRSIIRINTDGTLDNTFSATSFSSTTAVWKIFAQSDGRVVVAGEFTLTYPQRINRIGRMNIDGGWDLTFNPDTGGTNGTITTTAIQPDGKILIGGGFSSYDGSSVNYLARLNTDGTLDNSFNYSGALYPNHFAIQPDGKIVILGETYVNSSSVNSVIRINADGSMDNTFQAGAYTNVSGYIGSVAIQPDGKMVIGGYFSSYNGITENNIARLNADGSLDGTFPVNPIQGVNWGVTALVIQSDGKILIGTQGGNGIYRINPDGSMDNSLGIFPTYSNSVSAIAVLPNGRIIFAGLQTTDYLGHQIYYLKFADSGYLGGFTDFVSAIAIHPDGKILVAGDYGPYGNGRISCIHVNGSFDGTFGGGGIVVMNDRSLSISLQSDGNIISGGYFTICNSSQRTRITRLIKPLPIPTVTLTSASSGAVGGQINLSSTTGGSTGTVTYTVVNGSPGSATLVGNLLTLTGAGTVLVTASVAADANYDIGSGTQLITITKGNPVVSINSAPTGPCGSYIAITTSTGGSTGTVTYTSANNTGSASISTYGYLSTFSVGTVTITASVAADANYNSATATQVFTIYKGIPTPVIISTSSGNCGGTINLNYYSGGSTGAITYSVANGTGGATLNGSTLSLTAVGTVTVTLTVGPDVNYNTGTATQIITISKGTPVISFTSSSTGSYGGSIALIVNQGGSTGAVGLTEINGTGSATVSGNNLSLTGIGTVNVTANVAGDVNYNAGSATQTITIGPANQVITFNSLASICPNSSITLAASSTSGLPISYASSDPTIATISGNTMTSLKPGTVNITASQAGNANYYAASPVSTAISIILTTITIQPSRGNQSVCQNAAVVPLTVAASGVGTITYQWYSNTSSNNSGGTLISGATGTSYTPSSSVAGSLYYYAVATSSCGGTNSSLSGVIIVYATPTPVISGVSSVCANQTGVSYSTTNVSGHTYAWTISNGTITAGSGTNHITVTWGASGSGALTVTEAVSGIGCAVTTASFPVTIGQSPSVHITGTSGGNLCLTGSATLTATSGLSYRWSTGETGQSITVYDVGTYSCTVTFTGGCTGSASLNVIRSGSNCHAQERIKTLKNEPVPKDTITLSVYPVPADRTFTVTTSAPAASESPIFLYDLSGRIVATNHFQTGEQEKVISTEELSPGMYILRIIDSSHERFRKIIIQHD